MNYITEERKAEFENLVEQIMLKGKAVGMAVAIVDKKGVMQYEKYFGFRDESKKLPIDRNTIFGLASLTKSFVALSVMQLMEQGLLDIDDTVSSYCPYFTNKNLKKPLKIWHLLCHSGGFFPLKRTVVNDVAKKLGINEETAGDLVYNIEIAKEGVKQVACQIDNQTELMGLPGELLSYCNDGFGILSDIIRQKGKESTFGEYVIKNILEKINMQRSYCDYVKPSKDENAATLYTVENGKRFASRDYKDNAFVLNGAGAMKSTVADMTKYLCMWLNEGRALNGKRIISQYSLREILKPRAYYSPDAWYGYGVITKRLDNMTVFEHSGGLPGVSSFMQWSYDREVGIVVLCNTDGVSSGAVADAAMKMFCGSPDLLNRHSFKPFNWSDDFLKKIEGKYITNEDDNFIVKCENKIPVLILNGIKMELVPFSPDKAIIRKTFGDTFFQIEQDEERGIWGAKYGSRVFKKK